MRVGSSSDIYQLLAPRAKPKDRNEVPEEPTPPAARTGTATSFGTDAAAAALLAKLAAGSFNRSDSNGDGVVTRNEYVSEASKINPGSGLKSNPEDIEKTWSQLDKDGKGQLNEQEYADGFKSVFQVTVGSFSRPLR